ncbi:MAG TPA: amino acid adenylation domain-containing protein [Planctomycetota bacterium]|jgi:amino acid adenylation domain-containing protein
MNCEQTGSSSPGLKPVVQRRNAIGPAILARQRTDDPPLSFPQQRLWILDHMAPYRAAYNTPVLLRILGRVNIQALESALNQIIERHEALRTTFSAGGESAVQRIAPSLAVRIETADLRHYCPTEREGCAQKMAAEEARQVFNLESGPLVRARCMDLSETEHLVSFTFHHIVFDGWSLRVFLRELFALYDARMNGRRPVLPSLPIQYADFALWQRGQAGTESFAKHLSYWKQRLSGVPHVLELPADRARPAVFSYKGAQHCFAIPAPLGLALKKLCRDENVSLYMLLLSAFNVLLFRYTDHKQILVGSPAAGRNRSELEGLIGCFLNMLVMRTDLSGDMTFRALLKRVRSTALESYTHQEVPFERLVEELQPARDPSYTPLFQVMFALQNPLPLVKVPGLQVETSLAYPGGALCDLMLQVTDAPAGLSCSFDYSTDIFDPASIERIAGHLLRILAEIAENPDQAISRIPMLPDSERRKVLMEWNATHKPLPGPLAVHELVEAQIAGRPDAVAVEFLNQKLTYSELNARANRVAAHLRRLGVERDTIVPLCMERSAEMVVALLGILKAGGAYLPLDPSHPRDRLAFIMQDCAAKVVLTHKPALSRVPSTTAGIVLIEDILDKPPLDAPELDMQGCSRPEDIAYVMYTSGSTGKPKGVLISNRSAVNLLTSIASLIRCTDRDLMLAIATISFDIATLEMFLPLTTGARVIVVPRNIYTDGKSLANLIDSSGASILQATPITWRMLVEAGWKGNDKLRVITGGEALPSDLAVQLAERTAECWNMYGPTETTIYSTACRIKRDDERVTIGRPINNTLVYILDSCHQPVPVGVPGEIYIAGVGLARGYFNWPELTAEKFVADPFAAGPGARMYATGDLGRYLADGSIEYLGRIDSQVKIRGFRIELGEIEAVFAQHPDISHAAVAAQADAGGDKRLVAYVVPREGKPADPADLQAFLKSKLPEYMVPPVIVRLESLPLGPTGKVDRKALPAHDLSTGRKGSRVPPRDKMEAELVEVWKQMLGTSEMGVTDNFFELGGHSIIAVRLVAHIERLYGKNLPLATLFQAPTIADLAVILRQSGWSASWSSLVPVQTKGSRPPFYCVHPVGGNVLCYYDLAQSLGEDQPVYGLQAPGLDGNQVFDMSVEELARHHIREMRMFQPEGPYYLCGASMGGMVAFEMAQQLVRQGQKVGLLAMFDTCGPHLVRNAQRRPLAAALQRIGEILDNHCGNLARLTPREAGVYLMRKAKWAKFRALEKFTELFHRTSAIPDTLARFEASAREAGRRYVVKPYPGRITLFRASHPWHEFKPDPHMGWDGIPEGGLEVYVIPGYHSSIFIAPRVVTLAEHLRSCLARAQSDSAPAPQRTPALALA